MNQRRPAEKVKYMNDKPKELCIVCGENSGINVDMPINDRQFYVESAGQLCQRCYNNLYIDCKAPQKIKKNAQKKFAQG